MQNAMMQNAIMQLTVYVFLHPVPRLQVAAVKAKPSRRNSSSSSSS
jgi:hypothetical protein